MQHPTDRITHTTAFVTPVVEKYTETNCSLRKVYDSTLLLAINFQTISNAIHTHTHTHTHTMGNRTHIAIGWTTPFKFSQATMLACVAMISIYTTHFIALWLSLRIVKSGSR